MSLLPADRLIALDSSDPQALFFTAQNLQQALRTLAAVDWSIIAGTSLATEQIGLRLSLVSARFTLHVVTFRKRNRICLLVYNFMKR